MIYYLILLSLGFLPIEGELEGVYSDITKSSQSFDEPFRPNTFE